MRPSLVLVAVSLLLLSLFLTGAQGIRFKKQLFSSGQHKILEGRRSLFKPSDGSVGEVTVCKEGHCTTGMNRKLITTTPPPSVTPSKNEKNGENKANPPSSVHEETLGDTNSPPTSDISNDDHHVEDITDIAEMDYSPAKRKPPIHN